MNPNLLDPWQPYAGIEWEGQMYMVLTRDFVEDPFVVRRKFMLVFPNGKKRMLSLSATKEAIDDLDAEFGKATHDEVVHQIVRAEAMKEIKATGKTMSHPKVSPDVKLVPLDMEPPVLHGVDFAKVESEMLAHLHAQGSLPSEYIYGHPNPLSPLAPAALKAAKSMSAMQQTFKDLAAKYAMKPINPAHFGTIVMDSLAGVSKEEVHATVQPALNQLWKDQGSAPFSANGPDIGAWSSDGSQQLTPKGLATLKKFGVALAE